MKTSPHQRSYTSNSQFHKAVVALFALASLAISAAAQTKQPTQEEIITLSPFDVRGDRDVGYRATNSIGATRVKQNIDTVPMDISVVNSERMDDMAAQNLNEALYYTPGVTESSFELDRFNVRGFPTDRSYDDGVEVPQVFPRDAIFWDRVEFVKGPASLLYGEGDPGGVVNSVGKRPEFYQSGKVTLSTGSWGRNRLTLDSTGPLSDRDSKFPLAYRFLYAFDDRDTWRAFEHFKRIILAGGVKWEITPKASLYVGYKNINDGDKAEAGLLVLSADQTRIAHNREFNYRASGLETKDAYQFETELNVAITPNISLRNFSAYADSVNHEWRHQAQNGREITQGSGLIRLIDEDILDDERAISSQTDLSIEYKLFGQPQRLLIGHLFRDFLEDRFVWVKEETDPLVNMNIPATWGSNSRDPDPRNNFPQVTNQYTNNIRQALYLMNSNTFFDDKLHVITGMRYNEIGRENTFYRRTPGMEIINSTYRNSDPDGFGAPRFQIGALYKLTPHIRPFFSISESFQSNGFQANGAQILDLTGNPQTGLGTDIGVKLSGLFNNRLNGTITYFDIDKENIVSRDPETALITLSGMENSKGVDVELYFDPIKNWHATFGYTYTDAKTVSNIQSPLEVGVPLANAPRHLMVIWNRYDFSEGALKGWSLVGGFRYRSETRIFPDTSRRSLTSWEEVTFDVGAFYRTKLNGLDTRFQFNVYNITDETTIRARRYGEPRKFNALMSVAF